MCEYKNKYLSCMKNHVYRQTENDFNVCVKKHKRIPYYGTCTERDIIKYQMGNDTCIAYTFE